ncbi:MAG: hypothetical protein NVS9B4_26080 [Candidatus Acidiferrum sp.]
MYSLDDYGAMIADSRRSGAYAEAIGRTVRPGDVVVDLGCGAGLLSFFACRAGARRVFAIESQEIIEVARQLAEANGFSERIEFFRADSRQVQLPERANIFVCDVRGTLPLYGDGLLVVDDARLRFLAPGGVQIPQRDTVYATVANAEKWYERLTAPWRAGWEGVAFSPALVPLLNEFYSMRVEPEQILSEAQAWCVVDYRCSPPKSVAGHLRFKAVRQGIAHGLCLWFDAELFENIGYSCRPEMPETIYGHLFLPWLEPVELYEGDECEVELRADWCSGSYIWSWNTKFPAQHGQPGRHFRQSTFQSSRFSLRSLQRRATEFVPTVSRRCRAESWILQSIDGKTSLEEIAVGAAKLFPQEFCNWRKALRRVSELADQFSE